MSPDNLHLVFQEVAKAVTYVLVTWEGNTCHREERALPGQLQAGSDVLLRRAVTPLECLEPRSRPTSATATQIQAALVSQKTDYSQGQEYSSRDRVTG